MGTIFSKTYSGEIKRVLTEGQICPSVMPDMYIETEQTRNIDTSKIDDVYTSKIYNIVLNKSSVEVTTNTLGILLTDVTVNNIDYYYYIESEDDILQYLQTKDALTVYKDGVYYLNTNLDYISLNSKVYKVNKVIPNDIWNRSDLIKIRRLKDRFKITVSTKNPSNLKIKFISNSALSPLIHRGSAFFYDFIGINPTTGEKILLLNTTFNIYSKVEIHEKIDHMILKEFSISDVTIEDISSMPGYCFVKYNTFRSNNTVDISSNKELYISLNTSDTLTELSVSTDFNDKFSSLITINKTNSTIKSITMNPYISTKLYKNKPEAILFVWGINKKYEKSFDVPLGCERFKLNLTNLRKRLVTKFIYNGYSEIKDSIINYHQNNLELNVRTYQGTNEKQLTALVELIKQIELEETPVWQPV